MLHSLRRGVWIMNAFFVFAYCLGNFILVIKQDFFDGQLRGHLRLLGEVSQLNAVSQADYAIVLFYLAGEDLNERSFARSVLANQSNFLTLGDAEGYVFEKPAIII